MRCTLFVFVLIVVLAVPATWAALPQAVLIYTFDSIDGDTVKDASGNGNDGTMENNPSVVAGKFGDALSFEDSRVKVVASDTMTPSLFADGNFTLVLWMNAPLSGNTWQQVFRAGPDPNDTLFLNIDGRLSWRGWVGAGWAGGMCETDAGVVGPDTWTHVAIVGDTKNFQIYIDGKLSKESDFQETRGNNQEFIIGGYSGGESYTGSVDELAIYSDPLTEAQINSIMSKGLEAATPVDPAGKLAARWGEIKRSSQE